MFFVNFYIIDLLCVYIMHSPVCVEVKRQSEGLSLFPPREPQVSVQVFICWGISLAFLFLLLRYLLSLTRIIWVAVGLEQSAGTSVSTGLKKMTAPLSEFLNSP